MRVRRHAADGRVARRERPGEGVAEEVDHRDEHQVRQHAAREHDGADARADDVTDAEQFGRDFDRDRPTLERRAEDLSAGSSFHSLQRRVGRLVRQPDAETRRRSPGTRRGSESGGFGGADFRLRAWRGKGAVLGRSAGLEHGGAGGAFGVFEDAVFLDDERAAQRDHHQDAEQTTEDGDHRHAGQFQVKPEDEDGRHRHADAERDGFARRTGGLGDVVFEDGRRHAGRTARQRAEHRQAR